MSFFDTTSDTSVHPALVVPVTGHQVQVGGVLDLLLFASMVYMLNVSGVLTTNLEHYPILLVKGDRKKVWEMEVGSCLGKTVKAADAILRCFNPTRIH